MLSTRRVRLSIAISLLLAFSIVSFTPANQQKKSKEEKAKTEKKDKKQIYTGRPVLWRSPNDVATRDLYWGPGGKAMQPDLRRLTYVEEQKGGYSKKYRVVDASGREWVAKIGKEAQSETAAVRLMWAAGYETEINYLAPTVNIPGKGTFTNVRFEARPRNAKRLDEWKWSKNPFVGSRQFQGLKVMMALLNNWDIKDSNNQILADRDRPNGELRYVISDLGATFGSSSSIPIIWRITRSRNNPVKYAKAEFVDDVKDGRVHFHYGGKRNSLFKDISVGDARWVGSWLSRLSNQQLRDAFRAANYNPAQIDLLSRAVRERVNELVRLPTDQNLGRKRLAR